MTKVSERETVDITCWSRKERRKVERQLSVKIPGRNLPYQKALHGTVEDFYKKREEEQKHNGKRG